MSGPRTDFVVAQNLYRRHLYSTQRVLLGEKLLPLYADEAKQRQQEGGKRGGTIAGRGRKKKPLPKKLGKGFHHEQEAAARAAKSRKNQPAVFCRSC